MRRRKLKKRKSQKLFKRGTRTKTKNTNTRPMRGGYRA